MTQTEINDLARIANSIGVLASIAVLWTVVKLIAFVLVATSEKGK